MALIKCHECGTEVSTEAKTCPKCGATVKKPMGGGMIMAIAIGTILGAFALLGDGTPKSATPPEQKAEKEAENKRYALAEITSKTIRNAMRDPDSLKFDRLLVSADATVVCAEYRARNGFGGMNREIMILTQSGTSQAPTDWANHCIKSMHDMLWAAK